MGMYLNNGKFYFEQMRNAQIFVDKSLMIEKINDVINTPDSYICMTRPRRFGKSYAANMLAAYYDKSIDSHDLFDDLEIAKSASYEKHLNKYRVIFVDVQGLYNRRGGLDQLERTFELEILKDLHDFWPELVRGDEPCLTDALYTFTNLNTKNLYLFLMNGTVFAVTK